VGEENRFCGIAIYGNLKNAMSNWKQFEMG
jgi:hypothetical protein